MNSGASNTCPDCGAFIPENAPGGLCPKCLLAGAAAPTETRSTPDAHHREPPPTISEMAQAFPQLEIKSLIGQGGMGFVYRARQPRLERDVALKILPRHLARDPRFAERFTREGRLLARLSHPNIVNVFDFGEVNGLYFLLMEFVDGVNLRQAMRASRFTPAQALAIVPGICEALQYAHDQGVLHRDIKPENILIDAKGRVKIADFGIAKLVGAPEGDSAITATGASLGTPHYMAPEQLESPSDVDHRADIYSLGVVFYELLTGELPIGRFAPPSAKTPIDERVDEIVLRALARERELRQQSAQELKTEVDTVTAGKSAEIETDHGVGDWRTRVPFQAPEVREIYRHLTPAERRADLRNQAIPVALSLGLVVGLALALELLPRDWRLLRLVLLPVFLVLQLVLLIVTVDRAKDFLCSTEWAKARGIKPGQLRTFVWPRRRRGPGSSGRRPPGGDLSQPGTALAMGVALFYTGLAAGVPLVEAIGLGGKGIIALVCFWAAGTVGIVTRLFGRPDRELSGIERDRLRSRLEGLSLVAALMCLPVCGFGLFFLGSAIDVLTMGNRSWNPALGEAVIVPLAILGLGLLPWATWRLRQSISAGLPRDDRHPETAPEPKGGQEGALGIFLLAVLVGALSLAFSNPWGPLAWKWFAVVCTVGCFFFAWLPNELTPRQKSWLRGGVLVVSIGLLVTIFAANRSRQERLEERAARAAHESARLAARSAQGEELSLLQAQPPVVVETMPASGTLDVPFGTTELQVRFSKEMADGSWSWVEAWENSTPEMLGQPVYDTARRTCSLKVALEPGRTYAFWLNSEQHHYFKDAAGIPAPPYLLIFKTSPRVEPP